MSWNIEMNMSNLSLISGFTLFFYLYRRFLSTSSSRSKNPLPPGPKGFPIIGSLLNLDSELNISDGTRKPDWEKYSELGKKYNSDIIHINMLGHHTIVLSSADATNELLEKRSGIYSDRPPYHMLNGLCGWEWNFGHMRYSDYWRTHRKMFHQHFQPRSLARFHPLQRKAVLELVNNLMESSNNNGPSSGFETHLKGYTGSIILRITYGIKSREDQDYYVGLVERAILGIIHTGNFGNFLVDYLPLLKWVPSWIPGAEFKRKARTWAKSAKELRDVPWERLEASIASGTAIPCFATENLEKSNVDQEKMLEEVIKNCSGFAYIAAADTTVSLLLTTIMALLNNPQVQTRAQRELDEVVGRSRLPDFSDRENLPYIEAILNEGLRIHPVTPLAVPHHSTEDDVYEGYFIPKGATVVGNAWQVFILAILHDEVTYPEPFRFNPERFMKENGKELAPSPLLYAFGFGRRQCPGRFFALDTAWLAIACLLATCNITKAVDYNGNEIETNVGYTEGMISHPKPFKCKFAPRFNTTRPIFQNSEVED